MEFFENVFNNFPAHAWLTFITLPNEFREFYPFPTKKFNWFLFVMSS